MLYGEYDDDATTRMILQLLEAIGARRHRVMPRLWGLGVVQEIDAAAMSVWVSYRE